MKNNTYDIQRDLYVLTTMSLSLEEYITDPNIFHNPQGVYSKLPPMTLGTFLLRLRRISVLQTVLDVGERAQLVIAVQAHTSVTEDWAYHYQNKLQEEVDIRTKSIQRYIDELNATPDDNIHDYHPELYARTVIAELINQTDETAPLSVDLVTELQRVDDKWRSMTRSSYFHWDERLRDVYPENRYWWLYRELDMERIVK